MVECLLVYTTLAWFILGLYYMAILVWPALPSMSQNPSWIGPRAKWVWLRWSLGLSATLVPLTRRLWSNDCQVPQFCHLCCHKNVSLCLERQVSHPIMGSQNYWYISIFTLVRILYSDIHFILTDCWITLINYVNVESNILKWTQRCL